MNSFRRYSAILIILITFLKIMEAPLLYLDFQLRRDYIAQNLCENISKPALDCKGKCYLNKQLKKAQDIDQESGKTSVAKKSISESFFISKEIILLSPTELPHSAKNILLSNLYSFIFLKKIAQPPQYS